jgi:hypothetical protein
MLLDYMIPRRLLHLDETVLGIADLGDDMALCDWSRLGTDADEGSHESTGGVLTRRYNNLVESFITSSGEELTEEDEEDFEALADEAERGYHLDKAIGNPTALSAEVLLDRWRNLPAVDPDTFRADIDETLDASL